MASEKLHDLLRNIAELAPTRDALRFSCSGLNLLRLLLDPPDRQWPQTHNARKTSCQDSRRFDSSFLFSPISATMISFVHQRDQHGRFLSSCERERAESQRRSGNSSPLGSARYPSTHRNEIRLRGWPVWRL